MTASSATPRLALVWLGLAFVPLVAWSKDAAVVALMAAALIALFDPGLRALVLARPTPVLWAGAGFLIWALAAVAWSPIHNATDWFKAIPVIAAAAAVGRGLARAPDPLVQSLARPVLAVVFALGLLLLAERITGGFILGLARTGDSRDRLFDILSPGLALLSALAFPAAALLKARTGRPWAGWAFIAACFALGVTYHMDAAPVAIAAACISYVLVRFFKTPGFLLVMAGIAVVALSWGAVASLAWQHGEHTWLTGHINLNWGYRVEIWNRVHELIGERPWFGYGFDSGRTIAQGPGVSFLHPHNGLLQVRLELGLVGVVLFLGWGAAAVRNTLKTPMPLEARATIAATVTALAVFWLVSFGIWQGWWLAAIGLTLCALTLAGRVTASVSSTPDP
jgi:O-antigen ligase